MIYTTDSMDLTMNIQVGVSPEEAELVRKAVAMIMSVRQSAEMPTPPLRGLVDRGGCLAARGR